ncbi:MAG: class I SAM-dependent methyltransferase family protein [Chlamydiota bacterium]|nr:class I SAM-dependent methyltransferase family protein [Chlamydiota bacterium]
MLKQALEDFVYKKVIRNIMLTSKLGRQCVLGEASTGYNFDHMYQNKANGYYGFGRIIDFILLHLPAVKATRARKENILRILSNEIQDRKKKGEITRIMDVACGAGRYLTELDTAVNQEGVEIIGVDYDSKSLNLGRSIAKTYGISEKSLRFLRGNVFRLERLKRLGDKIEWRPNIILASGLIEYLDDDKARSAFKQIYEALDQGGLFLFFSQQSNPSKKLMEKVCTTNVGAWVLYYRQPDVLSKWLMETGFQQIDFNVDQWKMYNQFLARK